jgi:ATP phosphoribosyltransferase
MTLRIGLPKGALYADSVARLLAGGIISEPPPEGGRRLLVRDTSGNELLSVRATDVPTYVAYGGLDVAVVGKDVLMEDPADVVELLDLGFGRCRFVLAEREGRDAEVRDSYGHLGQVRVATKYPNVTAAYLAERGVQAEIIKLYGSIELAPLTGLAQQIVDLAATGRTLVENGLVVVDVIAEVSARLIANRASAILKSDEIGRLVAALEVAGAADGNEQVGG